MIEFLLLALSNPLPQESTRADIRQPQVVATLLRDAGYRAELETGADGAPSITSATNGDSFWIRFYNCSEGKDCGSLQFFNYLPRQPHFDLALANEWNARKRFLKVAIDADGDLSLFMDVTATGGSTVENFRDAVDWYEVMDAELRKFVASKREEAAPAP